MAVDFYGTVQGVKDISGINVTKAGNEITSESQLDALITKWLKAMKSTIDSRISQKEVFETDPEFEGISNLAERKVADLFVLAQMYRTNPIMKIDNEVTKVFSSGEWQKGLKDELAPFSRRRVKVYHSGEEI